MSSPIHSFLFSPPPSPPRRPVDADPNIGLTSLRSLLPLDLTRSPRLDGGLKPPTPRTPQRNTFSLDNTYPTAYPSRTVLYDPAASPAGRSSPSTPRQRTVEKSVASPPYIPTNVPSAPLPYPSTLPKPVIRLLFLLSLLLSSILLLVFVPSARLPSLRAAGMSRRIALDTSGQALGDIQPVTGWADARDRDYVPPQIRPSRMMRRAIENKSAPAANPRATRPALTARPLPASHELFALQSYLLSSAYNVIPEHVDPAHPLDANAVLGVGAHQLGPAGSKKEQSWLDELKGEREDDVVIWYGGDGAHRLPHEVMDFIASTHGSERRPTLISCHGRSDRSTLLSIFDRHDLPLRQSPIILIGNEPVVGDMQTLEEMRLSGELESMLAKIGWKRPQKKEWRPRHAVVKKKELSEVEAALREQAATEEEAEIEDY
ncbi:hypothetical protein IAU60_000013 [Kwoniella sp. DSM 27419]